MIAFFTQKVFATASENPTLPDGLLFGGSYEAVQQLGIEVFGAAIEMATVFLLSYVIVWLIGLAIRGMTTDYAKQTS